MEVIKSFIFVEEMKQSKSQQKRYLAAGAPGPKSQLFSQLKSDWEWDWNLKILNCPRDPAESWLERFREMGPDPEPIQSITGKEVCFNGKQQVFCGSFVSVTTRNLLSLSLSFFIFILGCRGCIKKEKHLEANCVWSSTQKKRLGNLMRRWESPIARNFPTWMSRLFCPGGWPILRQCLYLQGDSSSNASGRKRRFLFGIVHENAWPQNLWKTKRNWFSSWPDRSSSNNWSH